MTGWEFKGSGIGAKYIFTPFLLEKTSMTVLGVLIMCVWNHPALVDAPQLLLTSQWSRYWVWAVIRKPWI
jgi:hypothetical protein